MHLPIEVRAVIAEHDATVAASTHTVPSMTTYPSPDITPTPPNPAAAAFVANRLPIPILIAIVAVSFLFFGLTICLIMTAVRRERRKLEKKGRAQAIGRRASIMRAMQARGLVLGAGMRFAGGEHNKTAAIATVGPGVKMGHRTTKVVMTREMIVGAGGVGVTSHPGARDNSTGPFASLGPAAPPTARVQKEMQGSLGRSVVKEARPVRLIPAPSSPNLLRASTTSTGSSK